MRDEGEEDRLRVLREGFEGCGWREREWMRRMDGSLGETRYKPVKSKVSRERGVLV